MTWSVQTVLVIHCLMRISLLFQYNTFITPPPPTHTQHTAMLTGESVPISKNTKAVPAASGLGDRKCLAYSATAVSAGQGVGVVIATGACVRAARDHDTHPPLHQQQEQQEQQY
jgi:hypothetical protein